MEKSQAKYFYFFAILCWVMTSCANSKKSQIDIKTDHIIISELLDSLIPIWQEELNVPNVGLGLISNGKVMKERVYGNLKNGSPAPVDMLFNVASVTKVVFTALALQLIENGDLKLDESVSRYFIDPDLTDDERQNLLTPHNLLSQQSGFSNNWRWDHPTEKLTFNQNPGIEYNYSGEGMEYLQNTIKAKFGRSLNSMADSILFRPLEMKDTEHDWDGFDGLDRFSNAYDTKGNEYEISDYSLEESAADDLITTAGDLSKFGLYMIEKVRSGVHPYDQMVEKQAAINPNLDQGLGWRMVSNLDDEEYALQHGGNDMGVAAIIVLLPNSQRGVIIMTNGDNGTLLCNNILRTALPDLGAEIVHKSYKSGPIQERREFSEEQIMEFVGSYEQPSGRELNFTILKNNLHLQMSGIPDLDFYNESQDTFFSPDFDFTLIFRRDVEDNVNSCSLFFEGRNEIRSKKIE